MTLLNQSTFTEDMVCLTLADYYNDLYSDDRAVKRAKTDHGNHQSTNGDVTQSSATVITQQPVIQSTAAADVMPAYTYAPTWPGYTVHISSFAICQCCIFTSPKEVVLPGVCLSVSNFT